MRAVLAASLTCALLWLAGRAAPASPQQAGDLPEPRELFARAARAWAPDGVPPPSTLVVRGSVRVSEAGVSARGTWTELHRQGVGTRITLVLEGLGALEQGAAHGVVWDLHPAHGARRLDGFDADALLRRFAWYAGSGWGDGYRELRAPRPVADGRAALSLVAPFRRCEHDLAFEGREVLDTLTLELATGRPVELVLADHTRAGRPVERVLELGAWRAEEGGRAFPYERRERFGDLVLELSIETIERDVELADEAFAPPPAVFVERAEPPSDPAAVRLRTLTERPTAVIRVTCAPADVGRELGTALPELTRTLLDVGARVSGAPFVRTHATGPDAVELELGLPLAEPIEPEGRVVPSTLPGGEVASAWHFGARHTLGATHARLERWIDEHGYARSGPLWEVWWTDPSNEPDEARWRTELLCPIERAQ